MISNDEVFKGIKRLFYESYVENINSIVEFAAEIANGIPSCKVAGVNKDHNGISLSFYCDSMAVTNEDISRSVVDAIKGFLYNGTFPNNKIDLRDLIAFVDDDMNAKSLFGIMLVRGKSFSVII